MRPAYLSVLLFGIISFPVSAELYKWVDEEGNVHYSQTRPDADTEVESIKPPPKIQSDDAINQLDERQKLLDEYAAKREDDKKRKLHEAKEKEKAKQNCEKSREILAKLERIRKVNVADDDTDDLATDATKEKKLAQVKENIRKWCN